MNSRKTITLTCLSVCVNFFIFFFAKLDFKDNIINENAHHVYFPTCQHFFQVGYQFISNLLERIINFQSKSNIFSQLIAGRIWFYCFAYIFSTVLPSWNYGYMLPLLHSLRLCHSSNQVTKEFNKRLFELRGLFMDLRL